MKRDLVSKHREWTALRVHESRFEISLKERGWVLWMGGREMRFWEDESAISISNPTSPSKNLCKGRNPFFCLSNKILSPSGAKNLLLFGLVWVDEIWVSCSIHGGVCGEEFETSLKKMVSVHLHLIHCRWCQCHLSQITTHLIILLRTLGDWEPEAWKLAWSPPPPSPHIPDRPTHMLFHKPHAHWVSNQTLISSRFLSLVKPEGDSWLESSKLSHPTKPRKTRFSHPILGMTHFYKIFSLL